MISLVALTGSEDILDQLWRIGLEPVHFQDKLHWRKQAIAPLGFWKLLDRLTEGTDVQQLRLGLNDELSESLRMPAGSTLQRELEIEYTSSIINIDLA